MLRSGNRGCAISSVSNRNVSAALSLLNKVYFSIYSITPNNFAHSQNFLIHKKMFLHLFCQCTFIGLVLFIRMFLLFHWVNNGLQKGCLQTKKTIACKGGGRRGGGWRELGANPKGENSIKQANRAAEGLYGQYRTGKLLNFSVEMPAYRITFTFTFSFPFSFLFSSLAFIWYTVMYVQYNVHVHTWLYGAERRHGSTSAPAHASLAEVGHDGWLCTCNSCWKFHQLESGQLLSGQPVRYGKGRWYGPSITHKITHTRRAVVLYQPSSLRPHWYGGSVEFDSKC